MFSRSLIMGGAALIALAASPVKAQAQDSKDQDSLGQNASQTGQVLQSPPTPQPETPTLQIQPGSDVKGSDGAVLGTLEGVHTVEGKQALQVRGPDGALRSVPLLGLKPDGEGVAVAWTTAEFQAAPELQPASPETQSQTPPAPGTEGPVTKPDL